MKLKLAIVSMFLVLSAIACKMESAKTVPVSHKHTMSIKAFYDSTFNPYRGKNDSSFKGAFGLDKDSLKVKSLNATLFFVRFLVSHGTDFEIIRDDESGNYYLIPVYRGYMCFNYPIAIQALMLNDTIGRFLAPIKPMYKGLLGLQQFLNQSAILKKADFSLEQLDTIFQFSTNLPGSYPNVRIRSVERLDSILTTLFSRKSKYDIQDISDTQYIRHVLEDKLISKKALLYNEPCGLLVYEVSHYKPFNPDSTHDRHWEDELDYKLLGDMFEIKEIRIGLN